MSRRVRRLKSGAGRGGRAEGRAVFFRSRSPRRFLLGNRRGIRRGDMSRGFRSRWLASGSSGIVRRDSAASFSHFTAKSYRFQIENNNEKVVLYLGFSKLFCRPNKVESDVINDIVLISRVHRFSFF